MPEEVLKEEVKVETPTHEVPKPEETQVPKKNSRKFILFGIFGVLVLVLIGMIVWSARPTKLSYDSNSEISKELDGKEESIDTVVKNVDSDADSKKETQVKKTCKEILNFEDGKFVLSDCNYKTVGGPYSIDRNFAILSGKNIEEIQFIDIYTISSDDQRIFIGNLPRDDIEDALSPMGGSFSVEPKMIDMKTGEIIDLQLPGIEAPSPLAVLSNASIKNSKDELADKITPWSPDNKGIGIGVDGQYYYCSDNCELIVETGGTGFVSPGSAPYFIGSNYYYDTLEDAKDSGSKVVTKSIEGTP